MLLTVGFFNHFMLSESTSYLPTKTDFYHVQLLNVRGRHCWYSVHLSLIRYVTGGRVFSSFVIRWKMRTVFRQEALSTVCADLPCSLCMCLCSKRAGLWHAELGSAQSSAVPSYSLRGSRTRAQHSVTTPQHVQ